jgi:DNA repair protein RadD
MVPLRAFQTELERAIYTQWAAGRRNVLATAPTGAGKTVLFSKVMHDYQGASIAIAHRRELVSQISLALARNGVRHRIIAPKAVQREIVSLHMLEVSRNYVDPGGKCAVAGVDTLVNLPEGDPFLRSVGLWVQDEAHHVLTENKWGRAAAMMPQAFGLGVTATPNRADGKGLGRHADGVFDAMVLAPTMRDLINLGYLTDYRIVAPPSDLDISDVPVGASGEFVQVKLADAVHKSHIVGDVVQAYLKYARGKLGITFAVDVQSAIEIAEAYRAAGVRAEVVTGKTPDALRVAIIRRFRNRELDQLVNVDLFGEGFDLPAIECVSMARPSASFPWYAQAFGRGLRLMVPDAPTDWERYSPAERLGRIAASSKPHALIIDHVGNWLRHNGPPDRPRLFSLDRRASRRGSDVSDVIPLRSCLKCAGVFERVYKACPYCGFIHEPQGRSSPEMVDGDLAELDPDVLAFLRGELAKGASGFVPIPVGASEIVSNSLRKHHRERQEAQAILRGTMMLYGGYQKQLGRSESEAQRRFYFRYGIDVLNAQLLGRADAEALAARIAIDNGNNMH